jgi:(p)ppGpp synthase/HD superfamily hydrolase
MNWTQEKYIKAYRFAAEAHNGQLFPGTDLPYLMHVSFVSIEIIASLVKEVDLDGNLAVQCALLHDVIEDTKIVYDDVKMEFGSNVADGVLALTKFPEIDKQKRMQDSLLRIRKQPIEIWMVKLADRITNLAKPPVYWDQGDILSYKEEAIMIHKSLGSANKYLGNRLLNKIKEYELYLKA